LDLFINPFGDKKAKEKNRFLDKFKGEEKEKVRLIKRI